MWNKFFSQLNLIRFGLLVSSVAAILLFLPRADHQSFTFEQNQPWKYPLLTADFDTPILRDSASARMMRDSIDQVFVPFVKRDNSIAKANIERFANLIDQLTSTSEGILLNRLIAEAYENGLVEPELLSQKTSGNLRLIEPSEDGPQTVVSLNTANMETPAQAFRRIDSIFSHKIYNGEHGLSPEVSKALSFSLSPNIVTDSITDKKYRNQEYLTVTAATGVIKKGQRIVDRGEIVNPQIFTNLNTYLDMLSSRQSDTGSHTYFMLGQGIFIIIIYVILYLFLKQFRWRFFNDVRKMTFLMSFITLFVVFAIVMFEYVAGGIYLVPFAAVPVIILVFFDSRTAIFSLVSTVLISALVAANQFQFVFMEFVVGLAATFSIQQLSKRSQLLRTAAISFLAYVVAYFSMCLLTEGNLSQFQPRIIMFFAINSIILSFAYVLILIIEKIFGFTSTVTLVELSDINNPLLLQLAEDAPGTFQHSMQVSTLATEAARAIGANTTLVRTGALYHDIGKMKSPIFFTENQHGVNPHAGLNAETSASKIISHVSDGLALASKEKLPEVIRNFISEHHGRGLTKYFYNTAVNENPDIVIDKEDFRYPGPNPQSRETAILMMADCVEAASRSLKEYTPEAISSLVDKIIDAQISEGLLKEAPISMRDIETVKQTFKKRLSTIYHSRVAYPEMKKDTASAEAENSQKEDSSQEE